MIEPGGQAVTGRVAFLYAGDPSHELASYRAGRVPAHRLFGALDHGVDDGLLLAWPRAWPRRWRSDRLWRVVQAGLVLVGQRRLAGVVCTTEAPAPPVLVLRRLGLLRVPVVVLTVAALKDANLRQPRRRLLGWLLRGADAVVVYAAAQAPELVARFRLAPARVRVVPLGVDTAFFTVTDPPATPAYDVLSVGTNEGKDFATLLAALPETGRFLVVTDHANVARIADHPRGGLVECRTDVPVTELRELYRSARQVVVPLHERPYSSGQTVLLENLVGGRSVVVSDVSGVADYLDGTAARPVPAGDVDALRRVLAGQPEPATATEVARARDRFSSTRFAAWVRGLVDELAVPR